METVGTLSSTDAAIIVSVLMIVLMLVMAVCCWKRARYEIEIQEFS